MRVKTGLRVVFCDEPFSLVDLPELGRLALLQRNTLCNIFREGGGGILDGPRGRGAHKLLLNTSFSRLSPYCISVCSFQAACITITASSHLHKSTTVIEERYLWPPPGGALSNRLTILSSFRQQSRCTMFKVRSR